MRKTIERRLAEWEMAWKHLTRMFYYEIISGSASSIRGILKIFEWISLRERNGDFSGTIRGGIASNACCNCIRYSLRRRGGEARNRGRRLNEKRRRRRRRRRERLEKISRNVLSKKVCRRRPFRPSAFSRFPLRRYEFLSRAPSFPTCVFRTIDSTEIKPPLPFETFLVRNSDKVFQASPPPLSFS